MKRVILILVILLSACASQPKPAPTPKCSTDGGYQWCAALQKCVRPWETLCVDPLPPPKQCYCGDPCSDPYTSEAIYGTKVVWYRGECVAKPTPHKSLWMRFKCWLFGDTCSVRGLFI